jgi:hypothetical protein
MTSEGVFKPEILTDHSHSFNAVIRQSYTQAKNYLQDGMTVIRDEFKGIYDKAGTYFSIIALPVNNFLKDFTQIEAELQQELSKEMVPSSTAIHNCNIIPIEQALNSRMEENY